MEWLLRGKIDARHLARALPHTAQDLRDGSTPPERLSRSLGRALNPTLQVRAEADGFEGTFVEFMAHRLSARSIPEWWCRNEEQKRWLVAAHAGFARDLCWRCEREGMGELFTDAEALIIYENIAPPILDAVRDTCQEWAQRVDEALFKGRSGTFLFLCPTNALRHEDSVAVVRDIFQEGCDDRYWNDKLEIHLKKKQLKEAVAVVAMGALETSKSCWECEAKAPNLRKCSLCSVALYCGKGKPPGGSKCS